MLSMWCQRRILQRSCLQITRLFADTTIRGHANWRTVDDSRKDVSRTSGTIHGQTVWSHRLTFVMSWSTLSGSVPTTCARLLMLSVIIMPRPLGGGIKWWCCLTSAVCLSRTSGLSREQRGVLVTGKAVTSNSLSANSPACQRYVFPRIVHSPRIGMSAKRLVLPAKSPVTVSSRAITFSDWLYSSQYDGQLTNTAAASRKVTQ